MKRIFTLVFCMMILELLHSQAALKEELSDVEIIVTGVKENAGTIVISVHDSAESFGKRIPYLTAKSDATEKNQFITYSKTVSMLFAFIKMLTKIEN